LLFSLAMTSVELPMEDGCLSLIVQAARCALIRFTASGPRFLRVISANSSFIEVLLVVVNDPYLVRVTIVPLVSRSIIERLTARSRRSSFMA
jgi:hypothetical protein